MCILYIGIIEKNVRIQSVFTHLTANSRLLVSPERHGGLSHLRTIDLAQYHIRWYLSMEVHSAYPNSPRLNSMRHPNCTTAIFREDIACKPIYSIISMLDDLCGNISSWHQYRTGQ